MTNDERHERLTQMMRTSFEDDLPRRISRASKIRLQGTIPGHWFAAAASECASMYIAGFYYGAISVAQAYVEALSGFLAEANGVRVSKDPAERWRRLHRKRVVSSAARDSAVSVLSGRNDFHHLNKQIDQDVLQLEARAEMCVNHIQTIESEVFAHSFAAGKLVLATPKYWPIAGDGQVQVYQRQLW